MDLESLGRALWRRGTDQVRAEQRAWRLEAVMHVLYLMFSVGGAAGTDDKSSEAIRLRRMVGDETEVVGLS